LCSPEASGFVQLFAHGVLLVLAAMLRINALSMQALHSSYYTRVRCFMTM
jgi:hypothetical protein